MRTKNAFFAAFAAIVTAGAFTACDKIDNGGETGGALGTYVITATYDGANYIVRTDDISSGSVSMTGGSWKTTESGTYWVYYGDSYLFRLAYNQGSAGVSSSYKMYADGRVDERDGTYEIKRFTSYGLYDGYLITTSTGALNASNAETVSGNGYIPKGFLINNIDIEKEMIGSNTTEIWSEDYLGNGEFVTFAGIEQVGSRIFTAPIPMGMSQYGVVMYPDDVIYPDLVKTESGGSNSSSYQKGELQWSQHPDEAWVAIYDGMDFFRPIGLIKTDRISTAVGRNASQYNQMVHAADSGDVYVFSPSYLKTMTDERQRTTLPAGVVRIRSGADDFDPDYYCNLEEQSGGCGFLRSWHIGGDYFLLMMYNKPFTEVADETRIANRLAVYKAESKTLTYVTGLPAEIASFGNGPCFEGGKAYVPIVEKDKDPAIWVIDAATATATRGISVAGATSITSVGKLTYKE